MTVGKGESNKFEIETGTVLSVLGVKVKSNGRGHGNGMAAGDVSGYAGFRFEG